MRVAFYAPMKPPDDPVISGDRETARLILKALEADGHATELASRLRTWQGVPDATTFASFEATSSQECRRLLETWSGDSAPDIWITYHLYHKAPDWLGPAVTRALGIPYVIIEGCRALKHRAGPWASGFEQADRALGSADAVAAFHAEDAEGLQPVVPPERLFRLAPFIDAARFDDAAARPRAGDPPTVAVVAMMRAGDKEASYRLLAEALSRLSDRRWRLVVAGDGPRREEIVALFPVGRLDWRGSVAPERIADVYAEADLFAWPAINEAFGVALLEAQAAGLPVVAGDSGGVGEIVRDGETGFVVPEGDVAALVAAMARLIDDAGLRRRLGSAAAVHARQRHDIPAARRSIAAILDAAIANSSRRSARQAAR